MQRCRCWGQYGAGALGRASPTSWILVSLSTVSSSTLQLKPLTSFSWVTMATCWVPRVGSDTTHGVLHRGKLSEGHWGLAVALTHLRHGERSHAPAFFALSRLFLPLFWGCFLSPVSNGEKIHRTIKRRDGK